MPAPDTIASSKKRRRRLSPQDRRALIERAAAAVFAERGYEGATLQEIAAAAGVVASVIYDHYRSKEDLYLTLLSEHSRRLREGTIRTPRSTDIRSEMQVQIDDFFRRIEDDPFLWRTMFRDPPPDPKIASAHAQLQAKASQEITAALGAGSVEKGPGGESGAATVHAMVAELVKGALNGLASWWWDHREVERSTVVQTAASLLWQGLSQPATIDPRLSEGDEIGRIG